MEGKWAAWAQKRPTHNLMSGLFLQFFQVAHTNFWSFLESVMRVFAVFSVSHAHFLAGILRFKPQFDI